MEQAHEKRRFTRIPFDAVASLVHSATAKKWMVELVDISLKGVLFNKAEDWQYDNGERFTLHIQLAADEIELNMVLEIRHQEHGHIGAQIVYMDLDTATHLHRLVELNIGDEELLERELSELIRARSNS